MILKNSKAFLSFVVIFVLSIGFYSVIIVFNKVQNVETKRIVIPIEEKLDVVKEQAIKKKNTSRRISQSQEIPVVVRSAKSEGGSDFKNWLFATGLSLLVYTLKKCIDLLFSFLEKRVKSKAEA